MGAAADEGDENVSQILSEQEVLTASSKSNLAKTLAAKRALAQALGFTESATPWHRLNVELLDTGRISVIASDEAQDRVWAIGAVDYKVAFTTAGGQTLCTVAAIADNGGAEA